jgi:hypothetical protein
LEKVAMIAIAKDRSRTRQSKRRAPTFEELLPAIKKQASVAFRSSPRSEREELVAEVVANCYVAYRRLVERGLGNVVYPAPLAQYAILQVRAGRRVGTKLNIRDVSSPYCQQRKRVRVERLDHYDREERGWQEILVEDRRSTPAEVAAMRIDFSDWLKSLKPRVRRIAKTLATGATTTDVARKFAVSQARVSQIRRELKDAWEMFQGEPKRDVAVA